MNKLPKTYKDLLFWKNSFETAILVIRLSRKLPRNFDVKIILGQLLRAVTSISANIAEGYGRFGKREFLRYLQISLGSANETETWLLFLIESCPSFEKEIQLILDKNSETIRMLAASIKTIKDKRRI